MLGKSLFNILLFPWKNWAAVVDTLIFCFYRSIIAQQLLWNIPKHLSTSILAFLLNFYTIPITLPRKNNI